MRDFAVLVRALDIVENNSRAYHGSRLAGECYVSVSGCRSFFAMSSAMGRRLPVEAKTEHRGYELINTDTSITDIALTPDMPRRKRFPGF